MTPTQTLRRQIEADIFGLWWILKHTNEQSGPEEIAAAMIRHEAAMVNLIRELQQEKRGGPSLD